MSEIIQVVAGIVLKKGKILCAQKGQTSYSYTSFKFEFPGGKTEPGEVPEEALKRELKEELELNIEIVEDLGAFVHHYPDFSVRIHGFLCKDDENEPVCKEHIHLRWLSVSELHTLDWAAADLPFIALLEKMNFDK